MIFTGGAPASVNELSRYVKAFRESGKKIVTSAHSFNTHSYRIAAASSHIIVDRLGGVNITGYGRRQAYFGDTLEWLGLKVDVTRSGESKSAAEIFTRTGMSDISRRNTSELLGKLWTIWLEDVSENRGINRQMLQGWIGGYDEYLVKADGNASQAALSAGLVNGIEDGTVLETYIGENFASLNKVKYSEYIKNLQKKQRNTGDIIAVVPITGVLIYKSGLKGSDTFVRAIKRAAEQKNVRAIVLRINSPGGDVRAGEDIRRSIEEIRKDLPVVVSFGDIAASGGYWIALESDEIVSMEDSITGSIGVFHVSMDAREALSRWLRINIDGVGTTPWSGRIDEEARERMRKIYSYSVQDVNNEFRSLLSRRRGKNIQDIEELTDGKALSGSHAYQYGLVDHIGGLGFSINRAAEISGLESWKVEYFQPGEDRLSRAIEWFCRHSHEKVDLCIDR